MTDAEAKILADKGLTGSIVMEDMVALTTAVSQASAALSSTALIMVLGLAARNTQTATVGLSATRLAYNETVRQLRVLGDFLEKLSQAGKELNAEVLPELTSSGKASA